MNKTNNLRAYLRDLYEGIVSKKPDASRNPQNFRSEIEAIRTGGELYEVMDASELPEDAPNGSLALVEGEPIPEAYTVSSIDELPSNAVDGSMAIVPSDSLKGKWKPNYESSLDFSVLNLKNESVTSIGVNGSDSIFGWFDTLKLQVDSYGIVTFGSYLNGEFNLFYEDTQWDDIFEYIDFISNIRGITCIDNGGVLVDPSFTVDDFKTFIETNLTRLSGGYSLYTHENGQWVYKCEVV